MDFSSIFLGKSLSNIEYRDVENYFLIERSETDQIEFKSFAGKIENNYEGLIKTICGYLNSKGGLLILGAPLGVKLSGSDRTFKGSLVPVSHTLNKDQLISKCSDNIIPLPKGIRVNIIKNPNSDQCVCLFEVDESEFSPHSTGGRYYMRIDGQTKIAPHHYIEALFKRIKFANVEAYIKLVGNVIDQDNRYRVSFLIYFYNWSPTQNDEKLSYRVITEVGEFEHWQFKRANYSVDGKECFHNPVKEVLRYGELIEESHTILIQPINLMGKPVHLILTFGGRFSPQKNSIYKLDFNKFPSKNAEDLIIERTENQSVRDIHERDGYTKQSILSSFLNR